MAIPLPCLNSSLFRFRAEKKAELLQDENEKLKAEFHEMSQANMSFMSRFNEISKQMYVTLTLVSSSSC